MRKKTLKTRALVTVFVGSAVIVVGQSFYEARPTLGSPYICESKLSETRWYDRRVTHDENWGYQDDDAGANRYGYSYRLFIDDSGTVQTQETVWGPDEWRPSTWNANSARSITSDRSEGIAMQGNSRNGYSSYAMDYDYRIEPPQRQYPASSREYISAVRLTVNSISRDNPNDSGSAFQVQRTGRIYTGRGRNTFSPPSQTDVTWAQGYLMERVPAPPSDRALASR